MDVSGSLTCVVVAVDGSDVNMEALKWALDNLKLSSSYSDSSFVVLHVQPSHSVAAGVSPDTIPFGGPSGLEVPAFTAAIEQHQMRITDSILDHARQICADKSVNVKTQVIHSWWLNDSLLLVTSLFKMRYDLTAWAYRSCISIAELVMHSLGYELMCMSWLCLFHLMRELTFLNDRPNQSPSGKHLSIFLEPLCCL